MAVDLELSSKLVGRVGQAVKEPGSLREEECIYVWDMLLYGLNRVYALKDETVHASSDNAGPPLCKSPGGGYCSVCWVCRQDCKLRHGPRHACIPICKFVYHIRGAWPGLEMKMGGCVSHCTHVQRSLPNVPVIAMCHPSTSGRLG